MPTTRSLIAVATLLCTRLTGAAARDFGEVFEEHQSQAAMEEASALCVVRDVSCDRALEEPCLHALRPVPTS